MTTTHDITEFIDLWLAENQDWISPISVDFALDVRLMLEQLSDFDIPEDMAEPIGV